MAFKISVAVRNIQTDEVFALLNGGVLKLYTGTQPADTTIPATGTLIVSMTLANPAAEAAATAGVASLDLPVSGAALVADTIGWGRFYDSGGAAVLDGTVSLAGNGGDIITSIISVALDDIVQVVDMTITTPAL